MIDWTDFYNSQYQDQYPFRTVPPTSTTVWDKKVDIPGSGYANATFSLGRLSLTGYPGYKSTGEEVQGCDLNLLSCPLTKPYLLVADNPKYSTSATAYSTLNIGPNGYETGTKTQILPEIATCPTNFNNNLGDLYDAGTPSTGFESAYACVNNNFMYSTPNTAEPVSVWNDAGTGGNDWSIWSDNDYQGSKSVLTHNAPASLNNKFNIMPVNSMLDCCTGAQTDLTQCDKYTPQSTSCDSLMGEFCPFIATKASSCKNDVYPNGLCKYATACGCVNSSIPQAQCTDPNCKNTNAYQTAAMKGANLNCNLICQTEEDLYRQNTYLQVDPNFKATCPAYYANYLSYLQTIATTPAGTTPSGTTPSGTTPSGTTPSGTTPSGTTPSGTTPSGTTPVGTTPSGTTAPFVTTKTTQPYTSTPTPTPAPSSDSLWIICCFIVCVTIIIIAILIALMYMK